jgi:hypothetical protein
MVDHNWQVFVLKVFVQKIMQLRLRPNQMDPHRQSTTREDRAPYLRLRSFIGTYRVKRNVDQHEPCFSVGAPTSRRICLCRLDGMRQLLLRSFLHIQHLAAFVDAAFRASLVGKLLLVAARALGHTRRRQKVV